jgi:UrcA family protein
MKNFLATTATFAAGTLLCGGLAIGILSQPALAEPQASQDAGFSFAFRYSPSELATSKGANHVVARLERAVRKQCGDFGPMPLDQRGAVNACVEATMKASIGKFGSAIVAQAYQTRSEG